MPRKWVLLLVSAAGAVAVTAAVTPIAGGAANAPRADDASKSPLQKIMIKMEDQTKAIQKVASSAARFKRSNKEKDLVPAAEDLVKLGKETRKFTEPAATQKKPVQKWYDYSDQFVATSEEMVKVAKKGDFQEVRKGLKALDLSCANCHGVFRPKTGGDDFGVP